MIEYNKIQLGKMAQEYGFVRDTFEKVLRLKEILKYFNNDPYLQEHLVLKGGTAINMVIFNLPRPSVVFDIKIQFQSGCILLSVLLPDFSAHNLRHTFCTRLCENETNLKVIQNIMGHVDISTTMDIYADVIHSLQLLRNMFVWKK